MKKRYAFDQDFINSGLLRPVEKRIAIMLFKGFPQKKVAMDSSLSLSSVKRICSQINRLFYFFIAINHEKIRKK